MGNYGFLCCTAMDYVGSHCTFVEVRRAYLHVDLSKAGSQLLQFPKQSREITCCLGRAVSKTSVSCSKQFPLRTKYHTCFVSCLISGEFINQQCTGRCGFGVPPPPPGPVNNTRFLSAVFGQLIPATCAHQRQLLFRPFSFFPFHCLCTSVLPVVLLNNKIGDLEIGKGTDIKGI